jgi:hypothetical protein
MAQNTPVNTYDYESEQFDYMEIVLKTPETFPHNISIRDCVINSYHIDTDVFLSIMKKMKTSQYKYFQHDIYEKRIGNLVLSHKISNNTVVETKVYNICPLNVQESDRFTTIIMEKQKLSSIMFPSITDIDEEKYKRKLVFRVNNKVYVNFQQEFVPGSTNTHNKIYINFNNTKNTDMKETLHIIENLKAVLTS